MEAVEKKSKMSEAIKKAHAEGKYKNAKWNRVGKPHSEETKQKISAIRKKYLDENPDKVPYLLNHSSKESYPEKYFTEVFQNEGLVVEKHFRVSRYQLDFCIPERKIDIEIDGQQHYNDPLVIASDERRNAYLKSQGWTTVRVIWGQYQRLAKVEKKTYVQELISYVNGLIEELPVVSVIIKSKKGTCLDCGRDTWSTKSLRCKSCSTKPCYRVSKRKVDRPTLETLLLDKESMTFVAMGKKYGVSCNAVRKWLKAYEKECAHQGSNLGQLIKSQ